MVVNQKAERVREEPESTSLLQKCFPVMTHEFFEVREIRLSLKN